MSSDITVCYFVACNTLYSKFESRIHKLIVVYGDVNNRRTVKLYTKSVVVIFNSITYSFIRQRRFLSNHFIHLNFLRFIFIPQISFQENYMTELNNLLAKIDDRRRVSFIHFNFY